MKFVKFNGYSLWCVPVGKNMFAIFPCKVLRNKAKMVIKVGSKIIQTEVKQHLISKWLIYIRNHTSIGCLSTIKFCINLLFFDFWSVDITSESWWFMLFGYCMWYVIHTALHVCQVQFELSMDSIDLFGKIRRTLHTMNRSWSSGHVIAKRNVRNVADVLSWETTHNEARFMIYCLRLDGCVQFL